MMPPASPKPQLAFRVAVIGHRPREKRPFLDNLVSKPLRQALETVSATLADIWKNPKTCAYYLDDTPSLRLISALAAGADQLAVTLALDLNSKKRESHEPWVAYQVFVPTPFHVDEYRKDFPEGTSERQAFDDFLDKIKESAKTEGARTTDAPPNVLQFDGSRSSDMSMARAYEASGRFTVRNCDLVIAVWDGDDALGKGGTAEHVRYALRNEIPVWWVPMIPSRGCVLLRNMRDFWEAQRKPSSVTEGDAPQTSPAKKNEREPLEQVTRDTIMPAYMAGDSGSSKSKGNLNRTAYLRFLCDTDENSCAASRAFGRIYPTFRRWLSWTLARFHVATANPQSPSEPTIIDQYYSDRFRRPDQRAVALSNCERSAFLTIIVLGALALSCAVLTLGVTGVKHWATPLEGVLLAMILVVFWIERRFSWHGRWLDYRLLAELLRQQCYAALLGRSLPAHNAERAAGVRKQSGAWVAWYFRAVNRAAPFPEGRFDEGRLDRIRGTIVHGLLHHQQDYHASQHVQSERINNRLLCASVLSFAATLACVCVKLVIGDASWSPLLGVAAGILPAIGAACFALRAQGEFEIVAQRSEEMSALLEAAKHSMPRINLGGPLASQDLAEALFNVTEEMLADVKGWATIFNAKAVELGG